MAARSGGEGAGLGPDVTRRDFVGTTLIGAGAALLGGCPAAAQAIGTGWDGPGGTGDYRAANGNTARVVGAGHQIRDGQYDGDLPGVIDTGESYDVVVVGGGFGGLGAMLEFHGKRPGGRCLLIDNQAIFGGYAKANAFDVGGKRIEGAQASMNFILPETAEERANSYWDVLGLPRSFRFAERTGGDPAIVFPRSTSGTLYHGEQSATVGYHFRNALTHGQGRWVKDVWRDDLHRAAWPEAYKRGLLTLRDRKRRGKPDAAEAARLDRMTFAQFATRELGVPADVLPYVTRGMCITGPEVSAYGAQSLPGIDRYAPGSPGATLAERFISFPGGNTVLLRHFVKAVCPDAIMGPATFEAIATAPVNPAALDRPDAPCRLRQNATVVRLKHDGDAKTAERVDIVYERGGKLYRVTAKAAVVAIGSWVAKHIVADLPDARRAALDQFLYSPILIVNVALRNWRFLDRLGFSNARWSDGFGFFCGVRQPMIVGDHAAPFHPDRPIIMTFYVPFQQPGLPLEAQGPAARAELLGTSYARYEAKLVAQMQQLFAAGGFDARRDIAGIVLNRWGHAFVTPPPGFFFGRDGAPAPLKVATEPFGRIAFGQTGLEDWSGAARAGKRAMGEALAIA